MGVKVRGQQQVLTSIALNFFLKIRSHSYQFCQPGWPEPQASSCLCFLMPILQACRTSYLSAWAPSSAPHVCGIYQQSHLSSHPHFFFSLWRDLNILKFRIIFSLDTVFKKIAERNKSNGIEQIPSEKNSLLYDDLPVTSSVPPCPIPRSLKEEAKVDFSRYLICMVADQLSPRKAFR